MSQISSLIQEQKVFSLAASVSVLEASKKMAELRIGSVVVLEAGKLIGIFTERDLLNRVVAQGLDPQQTTLAMVMSKSVSTISMQQSLEECFNKMETSKCRHIPVLDGDRVVGIVTMRNILEWLTKEMKEENVFLRDYMQI